MSWTHGLGVVFAALAATAAAQPLRLGLEVADEPEGPGGSPKEEEPEGPGESPKVEEPEAEQPAKPHPWDGMDLSIDAGAGLLEFFHADLTYLHSRAWTLGVGLGFLPVDALLRAITGLDSFQADLGEIEGFTVHGEASTQLFSGMLFTRWYPWRQTFYLEANFSLWTLRVQGKGTASHELDPQLQIPIAVTSRVWVPMVGLHIGWRFYFQVGAYIDLGLGVNTLLAPDAKVTITTSMPEELPLPPQAVAELQATIDEAQRSMSSALQKGANQIPDAVPVFPTMYLRIGWAIDFNP